MSALFKINSAVRTELRRTTVAVAGDKECDWCGDKRSKLFQFSTETAAGSYPHRGLFCCKRCHDSWHHVSRHSP
jgi:hypothetical protein